MRLKLGRPDLDRYAHRFDVPPAAPDAPLSLTWLGVSTVLIDDGSSALLTDGYFSRPGLARIQFGKVAPVPARVDGCLARAGISGLAAVVPVHTHIDHVLDSALVAERTGALLVGGESAVNGPRPRVDRGPAGARHTEPADLVGRLRRDAGRIGALPPDRFPGDITAPVTPRSGPRPTAAAKRGRRWWPTARRTGGC